MKIVVKNLKGKQFDIEIEPEQTVRQVKEKIEEEQKIDANTQKLVAIGKVMDDSKTVQEYALKDGDFIVVMVAKPKVKKDKKPAAAADPAPATTAPTGMTGVTTSVPAQPSAQPTTAPSMPPAPVPSPGAGGDAPATGSGENAILRGEALENTIKEMESMGFARDECMRALRAAFYNAERAVDYLLNGIPADVQQEAQPAPASNPGTAAPTGGDDTGAAIGGAGGDAAATGGDNPLGFLAGNPMFAQLRQRLVQEPQFFQTFMNQLAQTQPQLHQAISANPQAFLQLLLSGGAGGAGGAGGEGPDPPGTIRVTPEEKDAIERLAALGFPKHRAIEAYFA